MQNPRCLSDMNKKGIKDLQASLEEFEQEGKSLSPAIWFGLIS